VRRLVAPFAVAVLVDDQDALRRGSGQGISPQQGHAPLGHGIGIPGRLGEEPLQALGGRLLGADHRFGVGQGGQRLVALLG